MRFRKITTAVVGAVALTIPVTAANPASAATDSAVGLRAAPSPVAAAAPTIDVNDVKAHLSQFSSIASANGGNRYAGGSGYTASVSYIEQKLRAAGYNVTRQSCTSCTAQSPNLIAEWPGGDANQVFMLGAHLDSVRGGPGINDNGSGSAGVLQVALTLARQDPTMTKRVRFAWWADEEQGLRGSNYYVNQLSSNERAKIKGYLNFDMIGSRNAGYFINNITTPLAASLKAYYDGIGVPTEENVEGANRSDDASFRNAGIASSGVAAGASARKTAAQAQKWGGTANAPYDSCYHSSCDNLSNVADVPLGRAVNAMATALWSQAVDNTTPPASSFSLAVSPPSATAAAGGSASASVSTATISGDPQTVHLSVSGGPAWVTASVSPASVVSGGSATLAVSVSSAAVAGTYSLTVSGIGDSATRTATFTLTITGGAPPTGCGGVAAWSASQAYVPGDKVSHNGHLWNSTWYSTGAEPGAAGSWAAWSDAGAC